MKWSTMHASLFAKFYLCPKSLQINFQKAYEGEKIAICKAKYHFFDLEEGLEEKWTP